MGNTTHLSDELDTEVSKAYECDLEQCIQFLPQSNANLSIFAQNIRSLGCNIDKLEIVLTRLQFKCDILVLSECWLECLPIVPMMNGYRAVDSKTNINRNDGT